MKAYAVRHKPSGLFIPRLEIGNLKGGSRLEPSNDREPRLFFNKQSARCFLSTWLRGIFKLYDSVDWETGQSESRITIVPQLHRKKEDMEIVEFNLVEVIE